jgi:hypothetical protein
LLVHRCNRHRLISHRLALAALSLTAGKNDTKNLQVLALALRGRNV